MLRSQRKCDTLFYDLLVLSQQVKYKSYDIYI